jgi:DNA integrity scanning protein DisA with diadenylate cyclase activity
MNIPSYQMHNVLNVYTRQLQKNNISHSKNPPETSDTEDKIKISALGKREAMIEKISSGIVHNIMRLGSQTDMDQTQLNDLKDNLKQSIGSQYKKNEFVFNIIDSQNNKSTSHLHIEDLKFLLNRLEKP